MKELTNAEQDLLQAISTDDEVWLPVVGASRYLVSNHGQLIRREYVGINSNNVKQHFEPRCPKLSENYAGYITASLIFDDGVTRNMLLHRIVAFAFIDNPEDKPDINHIDGDKHNNCVENLEWVTKAENIKHAIVNGFYSNVVPIKCLDTGDVYDSVADASRAFNISEDRLRQSINNRYRIDEGYTFIRLDGSVSDEDYYLKQTYKRWAKLNTATKLPVTCLDLDKSFESFAEAGRYFQVDSNAIWSSIYNKTCCRGHVFCFGDQVILDKTRYMNVCYTHSKSYKMLATESVTSVYDKAIVLSSGGMDSTTCISLAIKELGVENVVTVSVYYNQKHQIELQRAKQIAEKLGVKHYELDLSGIYTNSNCPLLSQSTAEIPEESYAEQIAKNGEGMVATYVPFRNGLLLSSVAALAQSLYPTEYVGIYIGAHADDAAGEAYADCSPLFMKHMNKAIAIGTYNKVAIEAPLIRMNKAEVCRTGLKLHTPYELTWSCYKGGEKPCGKCGTCIDRAKAFEANGIKDPALGE